MDDGTFESVWNIDTDPREVIGTGPFTIESYSPEESLVLLRNPNYWLKDAVGNALPYLDSIAYHIVPDFETELAMFKSGETDVHGVLGEEYASLKPLEEAGNFTIHRRGPAFGTTFLGVQHEPRHRMRRAMRALRGGGEAGVVPECAIPAGDCP